MSNPTPGNVNSYVQELNLLMGGTILRIVTDDDGFLGLIIEVDSQKYILWLLSDDEGNAAGSFELNKYDGD